jgi:hypothetical protein
MPACSTAALAPEAQQIQIPGRVAVETAVTGGEDWRRLIDNQLRVWLRNPHRLEDEGVDAPSLNTISLAIEVAQFLLSKGQPAPTRIVPGPDGSVVFERQWDGNFESLHVLPDRTIEHLVFDNSHLTLRETW